MTLAFYRVRIEARARVLALVAPLLGACEGSRAPTEGIAASNPDRNLLREASPAPIEPYQPPRTWRPWNDENVSIPPPDVSGETWYALVQRSEPLQRDTPRWQPLPPTRGLELAMPEGSRLRCAVTPLAVTPYTNDFGTKLLGWTLTRSLNCSGNDWQTWDLYPHFVRIHAGGEREDLGSPRAHLRERGPTGSVAEIVVVVHTKETRRAATTGPPQVVLNEPMDDD